jgi:hypothetical protein
MSMMDQIVDDSPPQESPSTSQSAGEGVTNTSFMGRIRRVGGLLLGVGSATSPAPVNNVSLNGGDLDSSLLNSTSQSFSATPRRRGKPPKSPVSNLQSAETATNWLLDHIALSPDPAKYIVRAQLLDRYRQFCEETQEVPQIDSALGKFVKQCFPSATTKRPGSQYAYGGISWKEDILLQQQQNHQQVDRDWGAELAELHSTIPTLRRVPRGAFASGAGPHQDDTEDYHHQLGGSLGKSTTLPLPHFTSPPQIGQGD